MCSGLDIDMVLSSKTVDKDINVKFKNDLMYLSAL